MLRLPWEVSRIVFASTPISLPMLGEVSVLGECSEVEVLRVPVLHDSFGGIDDCAVHVEEKAIEGDAHGWCGVVRLRAHCDVVLLSELS